MALCPRCEKFDLTEVFAQSIPPNSSTVAPHWTHSDSFALLRSSAESCGLCAILMGDANIVDKIQDDDCIKMRTFTRDQWPRSDAPWQCPLPIAGLEVSIGPKGGNAVHSVRHVPLWANDNSPAALKQFVMTRPVGLILDDKILKLWLDTCLHDHPACRIPGPAMDMTEDEEPPELPTRVIDVGSTNAARDPGLVETHGQKGRYVALSHCWGKSKFITTDKSSRERHMRAIPMSEISENFRNAINITQKLGYQYIWIDSLCIIQDDSDEWERESAKMSEIYSHASLVIAAANSSAAHEGFLKPRSSRRTVVVPFRTSPGVINGYLNISEQVSDELYRDDFRKDVQEAKLASRGWTLQERLLSRRIVFFGKEEFHWECRSARWSESTRTRDIRYVDVSAGLAAFQGLPLFRLPVAVDQAKLLNDWYMVVNEYTKRSLTKDSDKLPALSGIAKIVQAAFSPEGHTTYRAGLWDHDLPRALLWTTFAPDAGNGAALEGPSWSWISRDARIFPAREETTARTSILGADWDIVLKGSDPHGQVLMGILSLQGYIKEIASIRPFDRPHDPVGRGSPYPLSDAVLFDSQDRQIGAAVLDEPTDRRVYEQKLYTVPIRHIMSNSLAIGSIQALLLQDASDGAYRRVGVAELGRKPSDGIIRLADLTGNSRGTSTHEHEPFARPFQVFFYDAKLAEIKIV